MNDIIRPPHERGLQPRDLIDTADPEAQWLAQVPARLRMLLFADGTVTKLLEACFWEPVVVAAAQQGPATSDAGRGVGLPGHDLLDRRIQLRGERSGRCYATARSLIARDYLPTDLAEALSAGRIGIGELLDGFGLETYRRILEIGPTRPAAEPENAPWGTEDAAAVYRCYGIALRGLHVIHIREVFPVAPFRPSVGPGDRGSLT